MDTILFLHGWGGNEHSFASIIRILSRQFNCIAPAMPQDLLTIENYCTYIESILDKHNITRCHIVAHSFGARVTTLLCNRNPDRYGKLVLTGAAGIRHHKLSSRVKIRINKLFRRKNAGSSEYRALTPEGKATFRHVVNRDLSDDIKRVSHPTLLVWGEHDKATPLWMGKRWARLMPNATLTIYKGHGHFAYLDEAQRFASDVFKFLVC